ncbi:MAG: permease-like cell division protein FtsX [Bacteroidetes bacterium]|nr:permease-like cell division protein FtsX [Bacteroidota bacterium]
MSKQNKKQISGTQITSTISISLVLFLIGLMCALLLLARDISINVRENIKLTVVLNDEIEDDYRRRIERFIDASSFSQSVRYISKEEALEELISSLGENPKEFLGFNPLLASFEVSLNSVYANSDSVAVIESRLRNFEYIHRIIYQRDVIDMVNNNIRRVSMVLFGIALILLFISIALINNTIRLAVYSNRFLINTMKLVGATSWFIRKPYVKRGIINGLIAGLLAIGYLAGLLFYAKTQIGFEGMTITIQNASIVCFVIVLTGIVITSLSSYFAVGRYVRMSTNDMYFV